MTLVDFQTERRIIAAMIADGEFTGSHVLAELCLLDFQDFRNRALFVAIRSLEAQGIPVSALTVLEELWRRDDENETHIADHCGLVYIANLLLDQPHYSLRNELVEGQSWLHVDEPAASIAAAMRADPKYQDFGQRIEHDVFWLKQLSARRKAA